MLQGQTQQAMETYQMALVLNPDLVDAHTNLGNLYKATGDMEAAKHCYLEAIRIKPEFPIAWNNLAGIFKEEGQLTTSVAYYREALRLCPEFADAHSNLGMNGFCWFIWFLKFPDPDVSLFLVLTLTCIPMFPCFPSIPHTTFPPRQRLKGATPDPRRHRMLPSGH